MEIFLKKIKFSILRSTLTTKVKQISQKILLCGMGTPDKNVGLWMVRQYFPVERCSLIDIRCSQYPSFLYGFMLPYLFRFSFSLVEYWGRHWMIQAMRKCETWKKSVWSKKNGIYTRYGQGFIFVQSRCWREKITLPITALCIFCNTDWITRKKVAVCIFRRICRGFVCVWCTWVSFWKRKIRFLYTIFVLANKKSELSWKFILKR